MSYKKGVDKVKEESIQLANIQIVSQVKDWQEAVTLGVQRLILHGDVKKQYLKAVIENVKHIGTSFIVSHNVILPHARPEQEEIRTAESIVLAQKPFYFDEQKVPVKLLLILAPTDSRSHLQMLQKLAYIVSDNQTVKQVMECTTPEALYDIFLQYEAKV